MSRSTTRPPPVSSRGILPRSRGAARQALRPACRTKSARLRPAFGFVELQPSTWMVWTVRTTRKPAIILTSSSQRSTSTTSSGRRPRAPRGMAASASTISRMWVVNLPLGFAGSTLSAPEVHAHPALRVLLQRRSGKANGCPPRHQSRAHHHRNPAPSTQWTVPIYNLVPEHGYPAEFGYVGHTQRPPTSSTCVSFRRPRATCYRPPTPDIPQVSLRAHPQ